MIWAEWWFSDEAEQPCGPFKTKDDATEAQKLYVVSLSRPLTKEEGERFSELSNQYR